MRHKRKQDPNYKNSPVVWFCLLEDARRDSDFKRAILATNELRRLGIEVHYLSRKERLQPG